MEKHSPTDESEEPKSNPMIDGCDIAAGRDARSPADERRDRLNQTEYEARPHGFAEARPMKARASPDGGKEGVD
jgi:hypothetical protein